MADSVLLSCHGGWGRLQEMSIFGEKSGGMIDLGILALRYFTCSVLEEPQAPYNLNWEEHQTQELLSFVRQAMQEVERRGLQPLPPPAPVRVTGTLRVFIGPRELKIRPMSKTVLLLFLKHPEGIALKQIAAYRGELAAYYRRLSRSSDPEAIERSVDRILDLFNNELNVSIARVNRAVANLVDEASSYQIEGEAGLPKSIRLDRKWVNWES